MLHVYTYIHTCTHIHIHIYIYIYVYVRHTREALTDLHIYKSIIFIMVLAFLIYKSINLYFCRLTEAGQDSPVDLQIYESTVFIIVPAFCIYEFINLWIAGTICVGGNDYFRSKYIRWARQGVPLYERKALIRMNV